MTPKEKEKFDFYIQRKITIEDQQIKFSQQIDELKRAKLRNIKELDQAENRIRELLKKDIIIRRSQIRRC